MPDCARRDVLCVDLLSSAITLAGCRSRADSDGTATTQRTISNATATVIDQTDDGLRVEVRRSYSHTTDGGSVADIATHATYLVAENRTSRIAGEEVDPC